MSEAFATFAREEEARKRAEDREATEADYRAILEQNGLSEELQTLIAQKATRAEFVDVALRIAEATDIAFAKTLVPYNMRSSQKKVARVAAGVKDAVREAQQ